MPRASLKPRICPTTPSERAAIDRTIVVYHPNGTREIWYHYPNGFDTYYKAMRVVAYLTDPAELPPRGSVRLADERRRYVARADRQIATEQIGDIPGIFSAIHQAEPIGTASIEGFNEPSSSAIPATPPQPLRFPDGT